MLEVILQNNYNGFGSWPNNITLRALARLRLEYIARLSYHPLSFLKTS